MPLEDLANDATCDQACPVAEAHEVLGGKWTTLIFRELLAGPRRYNALMRALPGISPKMLADRLKMLEGRGLVRRTQFPTIPPTTEYALTGLGGAMYPVIAAMAEFGRAIQAAAQKG